MPALLFAQYRDRLSRLDYTDYEMPFPTSAFPDGADEDAKANETFFRQTASQARCSRLNSQNMASINVA